jgi:type VI secretion system protein VasD
MIPVFRVIPILAAALLAGLTACGGGPKPVMLRATMDVQPAVNPDSRGRPSPVVVRVYALKSLAAFNSASFFSLYGKDKETLGAELIDSEELQLMPGDKREFQKEYPPETRYVAVFAAFRDVEHAHWRDSIALDTQKAVKVQIRVENTSVSIAPVK